MNKEEFQCYVRRWLDSKLSKLTKLCANWLTRLPIPNLPPYGVIVMHRYCYSGCRKLLRVPGVWNTKIEKGKFLEILFEETILVERRKIKGNQQLETVWTLNCQKFLIYD